MNDPVIADLNRYLDDQDKADAWRDARDEKALEFREQYHMQMWQDPKDGEWYWAIMDGKDTVADEWTKTEDEAWVGLKEGMDRATRKAAEKWLKDQADQY